MLSQKRIEEIVKEFINPSSLIILKMGMAQTVFTVNNKKFGVYVGNHIERDLSMNPPTNYKEMEQEEIHYDMYIPTDIPTVGSMVAYSKFTPWTFEDSRTEEYGWTKEEFDEVISLLKSYYDGYCGRNVFYKNDTLFGISNGSIKIADKVATENFLMLYGDSI